MKRLPDFVIAGTMKSGTSSLAKWLGARADVHVAPGKEVHFFNSHDNFARGVPWYLDQLGDPGDAALVCDATPLYSFYPQAVERMHAALPAVKVVVCIREPGARAYSHYRHFYDRRATESRSFLEAVEEEIAGDPDRPGEVGPGAYDGGVDRYLAQGVYLPQLERLAAAYGRDRLHVVAMEDIQRRPQETFAALCDFLGLPLDPVPDVVGRRFNAHFEYRPVRLWRWMVRHDVLDRLPNRVAKFIAVELMRKERPSRPMQPAARARLDEFFAPRNAALAAWLGRDPFS